MDTFQNALAHVIGYLRYPASRNVKASHSVLEKLKAIPKPSPRPSHVSKPQGQLTKPERLATPSPAPSTAITLTVDEELTASLGWEALEAQVSVCERCPNLAQTRTQTVFGEGNRNADLMFIGEAPGRDEDTAGRPFVGEAGKLLSKIIAAMEIAREDVYITNVLKCRPDTPSKSYGNRPPTPEEMQNCLPYLKSQIALIQPKVIVTLGAVAVHGLFNQSYPMYKVRGHWHSFCSIPVMATYHPSYLLRNSGLSEKRKVWEDMLQVLEKLEKPITTKQQQYFLPKK